MLLLQLAAAPRAELPAAACGDLGLSGGSACPLGRHGMCAQHGCSRAVQQNVHSDALFYPQGHWHQALGTWVQLVHLSFLPPSLPAASFLKTAFMEHLPCQPTGKTLGMPHRRRNFIF